MKFTCEVIGATDPEKVVEFFSRLNNAVFGLSAPLRGECAINVTYDKSITKAQTIHKYPLPFGAQPSITMPAGAKILTVQIQYDRVCIWALVDPAAQPEPRTFKVYDTGELIPDDVGRYIGTYQLNKGSSVGHLFEV